MVTGGSRWIGAATVRRAAARGSTVAKAVFRLILDASSYVRGAILEVWAGR